MNDLERLTTDLQEDTALAAEFEGLGDDPDAWVHLASTHGYHLTAEEALGLCSGFEELSDDDLDAAAGGWDGP